MKKIILFLCGFFLLGFSFLFFPYLTVPKFVKDNRLPFKGDSFYNPYQDMDSLWYIANFHAHSNSWGWLTDGRNNNVDSIYKYYKELGYNIINISNYNKITLKDSSALPVYEHGINIFKRHQLCLGATKVRWIDYFFWQKLKHKQHIINKLKETSEFVAICHPTFLGSFEPEDFSSLYGYDAIEVFSHYRNAIAYWDSALSSGYYAVLLANDDVHNISNIDESCVSYTVINNDIDFSKPLLEQLKKGAHYGVRLENYPNEGLEKKKWRIAHTIHPKKIEIAQNLLNVELDKPVKEIRFIGQGGKLKCSFSDTNQATYHFFPEDTYIRLELYTYEGNDYIFNPIVRCN